MKARFTELEEKVWALWKELAFRDGGFAAPPCTRQELEVRELERNSEWDAILDLAYDGKEWTVGWLPAVTVAHSRWSRAMILRNYVQAESEIVRLKLHPDEGFDKLDTVECTAMFWVARMAQGDFNEPATVLSRLILDGPYTKGVMALHVQLKLGGLLDDLPQDMTATPELVSLAVTLGTARRATKAKLHVCEKSTTIGELAESLDDCLYLRKELRPKVQARDD